MLHQSVVAIFCEKESRIGIAQEGTEWKVNYFLVEFLVWWLVIHIHWSLQCVSIMYVAMQKIHRH